MTDRATTNLPSRDMDRTAAFYATLGFAPRFKSSNWMILDRGPLEVEFFAMPQIDPLSSWFSACFRVDDLDGLHAAFAAAGLPTDRKSTPRLTAPHTDPSGLRMFALVDLDGSLIRCIDNRTMGLRP